MTVSRSCAAPIGWARLAEYWLGELAESAAEAIDEHVLGCAHCAAQLGELVALGDAVRGSFRRGLIRAFVTDAFVQRLTHAGLRVREYRVPCNGSVYCRVAPEDEATIARLEAPLAGVHRIDVVVVRSTGAHAEVFRDIPFDPASGEVVVAAKIDALRRMPSHMQRVRLLSVEESGERVIGEYTFNHRGAEPG